MASDVHDQANGPSRLQATDALDNVFADPSEELLWQLISGLSAPGNYFVMLQRVPDNSKDGTYIQTAVLAGGRYTVEYQDGDLGHHFQAEVDGARQAYDALVAWAFERPGCARNAPLAAGRAFLTAFNSAVTCGCLTWSPRLAHLAAEEVLMVLVLEVLVVLLVMGLFAATALAMVVGLTGGLAGELFERCVQCGRYGLTVGGRRHNGQCPRSLRQYGKQVGGALRGR